MFDDEGDDEREGTEPDYRFTLANERTFLAWMRTSLGLLAAGVAVRFVAEPFEVDGGRTTMAVAAISVSAVCIVLAYLRWVGVQRAMRHGEPLPRSIGVPLLAASLAALAVFGGVVAVL